MKAILVNDDRSLRWDFVPDPTVGDDEVLIKIGAAALNRADLMQREGDYPPPAGCPEWMGLEVAGEIVEMGEGAKKKSSYATGDRVCALLGGGGYAEYVTVKYDMLMPIPKGCSTVEAAAIPEAFATAYLNLFIEGGLKAGNTLLMNAGASGLASVIIPMAKAFGARVITTVLTDAIAEGIKHLGADRVVVTSREDIALALKEEMEALAEILAAGGDPTANELTEKHAEWVKTFEKNYTFTKENALSILHREIGRTFSEILEDAGVYKRNEAGKAAFLRFLSDVGATEIR